MARRKKKGESIQPFQTTNGYVGASVYTPITESMRHSKAWQGLTGKQIGLYCLAVQHRHMTITGKLKGPQYCPQDRWPGYPGITNDCFFLNRALAIHDGLYTPNDERGFYRDIRKLKECGFLEQVITGKLGMKSVFRMSEGWKKYI